MSTGASAFVGRLNRNLFPAVPVTCRADGSIDWDAHERYVAWMMDQPIGGVAVWAHTGRGLKLGPEARGRVLRQWVDAAAGKLVIAGVGAQIDVDLYDDDRAETYRLQTLRMAEQALAGGAQVLMMYAPLVYRGLPEQDRQIVRHVEALCSLDAPVILFYLYEAAGGINYSLDVLRELFSFPQVVGIKMATLDSVMTFQDVASLVKDEFATRVLISGEDRFLGYSLMCGATSALIGMGAACVAPQAKLLRYWFDGHHQEFVQLNAFVDGFAQATFRHPLEGYVQRMLWCLAETGVIPDSAACDPWAPELAEGERELVRRRLRALVGAV